MKNRNNRKILIISLTSLGAISLIVGCFFLIKVLNKSNETYLYNDSIISILKENNVYENIKDKEYSKTLDSAISENNYEIEYLVAYTEINYKETSDFIEIVNSLLDLKYSSKKVNEIIENLNTASINSIIDNKIDNINEYYENALYIDDKLERYIDYVNKNDYSINDAIIYVNIGLDNEFYSKIKTIENYNETLTLINKYNKLPDDYEITDLVPVDSSYSFGTHRLKKVAYENLKKLLDEAKDSGYTMKVVSSFRTSSTQNTLFTNSLKKDGEAHALIYSAKKGHSEHQLGLAVDVSETGALRGFEKTKSYSWLKENAYKYGFIERYPKDKEFITGYGYEPWHYRYIGIEAATIIYNEKLTFEEYHVKYLGYSS